jgi:hypothetical protein
VLAISPLHYNWAIRFCSHAVFASIEDFETAVRAGQVAEIIADGLAAKQRDRQQPPA